MYSAKMRLVGLAGYIFQMFPLMKLGLPLLKLRATPSIAK